MKRNFNSSATQRGFTLIEMVIVVAFIALIVAFAANSLFGKQDQAKFKLAATQLQTLAQKVTDYQSDVGALPSSLQDLVQAPSSASGWLGPYAQEKEFKDPWGVMIEYRSQSTDAEFELVSLGADKKPGGEGVKKDIVVKP
jgi:general secretion pathway protein G